MAGAAPPEVLRQVFQHLEGDATALLPCLKVCCSWYEPAKESLYAEVVLLEQTRQIKSQHASRTSTDLLLQSLTVRPDNAHHIRHLHIGSLAGFCLLPQLPHLRSLSVNLGSSQWQTGEGSSDGEEEQDRTDRNWAQMEQSKQKYHATLGIISSLAPVQQLRSLRFEQGLPDIPIRIISLCPSLEHLEFFMADYGEYHDWSQLSYPTVPPLTSLHIESLRPMSRKAVKLLVNPVSATLRSLFLNNMDGQAGQPELQDGDVDSSSAQFWEGINLPNLRHLSLSGIHIEGVIRVARSARYLQTLALREMVGNIEVGTFLRDLPSSLQKIDLHLPADDDVVVEAFIAQFQDAAWLPKLSAVPQIWTDLGYSLETRRAYFDRIRGSCLARGLHWNEHVENVLFSHWGW